MLILSHTYICIHMDYTAELIQSRSWTKLRFENNDLECLYQRYTLKLHRFSVIGVLALMAVLCGVMAALSLYYTGAPTLHVLQYSYDILS